MKMSCPDNRKSSVALLLGRKLSFLSEELQNTNAPGTQTEVDLQRGGMWRVDGDGLTRQIECREGKVWVTQTGCPEDIVLAEGESATFCGNGLILIEALEESNLIIQ